MQSCSTEGQYRHLWRVRSSTLTSINFFHSTDHIEDLRGFNHQQVVEWLEPVGFMPELSDITRRSFLQAELLGQDLAQNGAG